MDKVEDWGVWKEGGCLGHAHLVTMVAWPECLGEETVPLSSCTRLLLNLAPTATVHPLGSKMDKLALRTQSSSVSVVPDRGSRGLSVWEGGSDPA